MFSKLFHRDVFLPEWMAEKCLSMQSEVPSLVLSRHLLGHCVENDRFSHEFSEEEIKDALALLQSSPIEPFEVEFGKDLHYFGDYGWFVVKFVVRIPREDGNDISVVISPHYTNGIPDSMKVRTAWKNRASDLHSTLDRSKYCTKEEWHDAVR